MSPRGQRSLEYRPRAPEHGVLHRVIQEHLETFLATAAEASSGGGIPRFVENELRAYTTCGRLSAGFARFRCRECSFERLLAFACKGRGLCPSCGGKRMTQIAADLVDRIIPVVPVRQYVLSLPYRLRYLLAYDHDRCIAALGIFVRALQGFYRDRARRDGIPGGRTGSVTFIQRFGSAANLNIHAHVLLLDGVFTELPDGQLHFHPAAPPTTDEVATLLLTIRKRMLRHLGRKGLLDEDPSTIDPFNDEAPLLASCYATSIASRQVLGERPGAPLDRLGRDPGATGSLGVQSRMPLQAHFEGFDLHAALSVASDTPQGRLPLEKLARYCARPPIVDDSLTELQDGRIALELKVPWRDGSTHILHDPLDFLAKLAALIPRPRKNLVLYHGVLSPHAAWRSRAVAYGRAPDQAAAETTKTPSARKRWSWADLMRRAFGFEVLACPKCAGKMVLVASIMQRAVIRKILTHLRLPTELPTFAPARAPPNPGLPFDHVA